MNRLANAFSTALPSADFVSYRESPRPASPLEPPLRQSERRWDSPAELFDDPRSPYDQPSASSSRNVSLGHASRGANPQATDDGLSRRLGLLRPGERNHSRSRSRTPRRDRSVRANLFSATKQWTTTGAKLTGLAKGSEGRYAVGGGQSLKIIQLALDGRQDGASESGSGSSVREVVNLWKGSWGPQRGVTDLDWGMALSTKVVTAQPSGNWSLFDLERGRLEKEVVGGHPRPLTCIKLCPLPAHGHLLLTGGVEGQVKVWDLRERDPGVRKYFKHSIAVTSICFSPTEAHAFLVGLEQGSINRYDMRNHSKTVGRVYGAHGTKPVMDLKWKAEDGDSWLASSGADRTIQVWDMVQNWQDHPSPIHSIHTANPIRRLAWRPDHTTEIAAAPMSQYLDAPADGQRPGGLPTADADAYVRIWDVRRHHIAKYALPTPDGGAIDVAWEDDGALVACFQEGAFLVQDMQNHVLPIDVIRRQVVGWNIRGEIAYAVDKFKQGEVPFDDVKAEHVGAWRKLGRKEKSIRDDAYVPLQNIGTLPMHTFDEEEWIYLANHYRIKGDAPENLCRWNAEVAEVCGRVDDARLWIFLKHLIEEFASTRREFNEGIFSSLMPAQDRLDTPLNISPNMSPGFQPRRGQDVSSRALSPVLLEPLPNPLDEDPDALWTRGSTIGFHPPDDRRISDAQSRFSGSQQPGTEVRPQSETSSIAGDYPDPYGVTALDQHGASARPSESSTTRGSGPKPFESGPPRESPRSSPRGESGGARRVADEGRYGAEWQKYRKDRCKPLADWWTAVVDDGDIQLSTCIAVIGSAVMAFPPKQVERIAHAYVDMLDRHRLSIAASVIRLQAGIDSLHPGDQGITHLVHCDTCGRSTGGIDPEELEGKKVWWCRRCKQRAKTCSVCRRGVEGMWFGCNRCKHGGHQRCMRMYYLQAPTAVGAVTQRSDHAQGPLGSTYSSALGTSHGSSTYISAHSARTPTGQAEVTGGYNECPTGCGCLCRSEGGL